MSVVSPQDLPILPPQVVLMGAPTDNTSVISGGKHGGKGKRGGKGKGKGKGAGKGKGKYGDKGGGKGGKGGKRNAPTDRSNLAGVTFPVGRIHRRLRERLLRKQRCGPSAAVYMAAMLEYLTAEVLELAVTVAQERKVHRIKPRELLLAIRSDAEVSSLINATISHGGVTPGDNKSAKNIAKKKSSR